MMLTYRHDFNPILRIPEKVYTRYLQQFAEIANLKVIGSYRHVARPDAREGERGETLFLLGVSRAEPRTYYLRTLVENRTWTAWESLDLFMNPDGVTPIFAFDRLFLFWVELVKQTESRPVRASAGEEQTDDGFKVAATIGGKKLRLERNVDVFKAMVKFSYRTPTGAWSPPQTYMDLGRPLEKFEAVRPEWRRVYLQRFESIALDTMVSVDIAQFPGVIGGDDLVLSAGLKDALARRQLSLSAQAVVRNLTPGSRWLIEDTGTDQRYVVTRVGDALNFVLAEQRVEDRVNVLALGPTSSVAVTPPPIGQKALSWEFWTCPVEALPRPDLTQTVNLPGQRVRLVSYGATADGSDGLEIATVVSVARDPNAPNIPALEAGVAQRQAERDARERERNQARQELIVLEQRQNPRPSDEELARARQRLADAEGALGAAQQAFAAAQRVLDEGRRRNQWQPSGPTLTVTLRGNQAFAVPLTSNTWQHVALTLAYDDANRNYTLTLTRWSQGMASAAIASATVAGVDPLAAGQNLRLGVTNDTPIWFNAQLSELRLWDHVRSAAAIELNRQARRGQDEIEPRLFVLPLDGPLDGGVIAPAAPGLRFTTLIQPTPPEQRERILLLWGDEIQRSIRNTLQNDEEFTLSLRSEDRLGQSFAVDLAASTLYLSTEARLSLNDYAVGLQTTLSRFPADMRMIVTAAARNNYALRPEDVTRIRPLLGNLSAFGKVENLNLQDATSVRGFISDQLRLPEREIKRGNEITVTNRLLDKISSYQASFIDVNNQPGWYIVDTADEQFLVRLVNRNRRLQTAEERLRFFYAEDGWRGEYFSNIALAGSPTVVRNDRDINFNWGGGSPAPGMPADNFSVRWTRDMLFENGDHTFSITSDDGMRFYIDGDLVLDKWQDRGAGAPDVVTRPLDAGWHSLRLEYYERGGAASVRLTLPQSAAGAATPGADASTDGVATRSLKMYYAGDEALRVSPEVLGSLSIELERLSTYAAHELGRRLFAGGVDALLSLDSQQVEEIIFADRYQPATLIVPPGFDRATGTVEQRIDFDGAYGLYYREIFFHIPFFLANQLNTAQRFEEAQRWYHYIFNPTTNEPAAAGANPNDRYWQFRPFRGLSLETLRQMLGDGAALDAYRKDPFDPHAIAALRLNAYQKAIVMKYIDNLLDWGDNLFMQDTREAIGEAVQVYFLAYNILGPRPKSKPAVELNPVGTLDDVLDARGNPLPDFVVELARQLPSAANGATALTPNNVVLTSFGVPENDLFLGYWDRVEDRLYKIRHSLNFEGTFRQLALFQPPIDPMALVNAVAGGRDLGSVMGDLRVPAPHYRYAHMMEKSKEIAGVVKDFGEALLGALEKKDEGELAALERTHARQILDMTTQVKELEVEAAAEELEALKQNREGLQDKYNHFKSLIDKGLNGGEIANLLFSVIQYGTNIAKGVTKALGEGVEKAPPPVQAGGSGFGGSPVGTTQVSGKQISFGIKSAAESLDAATAGFEILAGISEKAGEYERRKEEWEHEQKMAQHELDEIDAQIKGAFATLNGARRELEIHKREIVQHEEVAEFHRRKFTNTELYSWTVARLTNLHFQAYKLAYAYARAAEKSMQLEMLTNQSFVSFGHWDSLRRGLLAGESLLIELSRMEKWHLDNDSRYQEMEKIISMSRSMPEALNSLKQTGTAEFQLSEAMFNRDFPGHYGRMLKMVYITVKTTNGLDRFDGVHATLYQLGNKVLVEPNIGAVRYLMGMDGAEAPDGSVLRVNWRPNQQIAITRVEEDIGVFQIDFFFDNRYFPFEGTGAVSSWRLEIPRETNRFDLNSITDVEIKIGYSSKYDNGAFRQAVSAAVRELDG